MKQLKDIKVNLILAFMLLLSCSNSIKVDDKNLVLNDIVNNELIFSGKNKDDVYKALTQENLLDNENTWFYIDRNFYVENKGILLDSSWINSKREDIAVIWFSKKGDQRKLFEKHLEDNDKIYFGRGWNIVITYDVSNERILLFEYEF